VIQKFALVFLTLILVLGANVPENMISRLGFSHAGILSGLTAFVIAGLLMHRRMALVVIVTGLAALVNIPSLEQVIPFGLDRDILTASLIAIVIAPMVAKYFDLI
jgi:hypothetical protein